MRALTLLESLAEQSGNPYKIDASKLGAIGISTGAIATSVMNGVDNRMKAAVMVASAGNWQRSLRYPNSWLYHDIFVNTRNQPYNGKDPVNSIANVDTDPTLISFLSRFDPIRYAPRQHGPVMTIIGTHDQYFPLPNANLAQIATLTLGAQTVFQKRLWLVQNATNSMLSDANLFSLSGGIRQWLDFCFGKRAEPLATPQISLVEAAGGLRFEITLAENSARLTGSTVQFFAATRIDSTGLTPFGLVQGFNTYPAIRDGTRFIASIVEGEKSASGDAYTAQNVIYFATINDPLGLPVSSLVYKGKAQIDLSTDFTHVLEHHPSDQAAVPAPPNPTDALRTAVSSISLSGYGCQGMALSNPSDVPMAIRIEARDTDGRPTAGVGLASPAFLTLQPHADQIFVADQVLGAGASIWNGSFQIGWSDRRGTSLAFRGNGLPIQLDGIGPLAVPDKSLWVPLLTEHDTSSARTLRVRAKISSHFCANPKAVFRVFQRCRSYRHLPDEAGSSGRERAGDCSSLGQNRSGSEPRVRLHPGLIGSDRGHSAHFGAARGQAIARHLERRCASGFVGGQVRPAACGVQRHIQDALHHHEHIRHRRQAHHSLQAAQTVR